MATPPGSLNDCERATAGADGGGGGGGTGGGGEEEEEGAAALLLLLRAARWDHWTLWGGGRRGGWGRKVEQADKQ